MKHVSFRKFLYTDSMQLFESNGYSRITDNFINFIIKNKSTFHESAKYTGWTYNKEQYSIIKNGNGKKIYMYITDIDDANGFIMRKEYDNRVIIVLDKSLTVNMMKSVLQHELSHMLKQESSDKFDPLSTNKESISNIQYDIFDEFNIRNTDTKDKYITKITDILYNFAPNEQSATINGACRYLDQFNKKRIFSILKRIYKKAIKNNINKITGPYFITKESQIVNIAKYIDKTHLLTDLYSIKKNFYGYNESIQLMLCYILNNHKLLNKKLSYINYKTVYRFLHGDKSVINSNIDKEIEYVYNWITDNIEQYKKKLYNSLYAIMDKKDLFLTDKEKDQIIKEADNYNIINLKR